VSTGGPTVRELVNLGCVIEDKVRYWLKQDGLPWMDCSIEISIVGSCIFISAHNADTGAEKLVSTTPVDELETLFLDYRRVVDRILIWTKETKS
jgi:hypothetical protein